MNIFLLNSFRNGLSDYENAGVRGSFKFGSNLDIRKSMDSLSCQQALADDLATGTMTDIALFIVDSTDGNSYHFCRDGKIYKRTSGGSYTLVYTDATGVISGAAEWVNDAGDKYLIWATDTDLSRKELSSTGGSATEPWDDVDATFNGQNYPKTNLTDTTWHTMAAMNRNLYIANANTLAFVGYDDSYSNDVLQLIPGNSAKCLLEYNEYAYIGCSRDDNSQRAALFVWDMAQSLNWNRKRLQGAAPINSMIDAEFPLMQNGSDGRIGIVDTLSNKLPLISFPGGGSTNPDGADVDGDLALFGVYGNGTGKTGLYTYGRKRKNASIVLNLDYALECDEIGSVAVVGDDILISYKDGSDYGVKKVDTSNKATGTYQSMDLKAPVANREPVWSSVRLTMAALPASCSVEVWRRIDKDGSFVQANLEGGGTSFSTTGGEEAVFYIGDKGKTCEIQIILNPSGNTCPEIYQVEIHFT